MAELKIENYFNKNGNELSFPRAKRIGNPSYILQWTPVFTGVTVKIDFRWSLCGEAGVRSQS